MNKNLINKAIEAAQTNLELVRILVNDPNAKDTTVEPVDQVISAPPIHTDTSDTAKFKNSTPIFDADFSDPDSLKLFRRELMDQDLNEQNHGLNYEKGRRHAAYYDKLGNGDTYYLQDGVLVQRGMLTPHHTESFVLDPNLIGHTAFRDGVNHHRAKRFASPVDMRKNRLHTSWLDTFANNWRDGKQRPTANFDSTTFGFNTYFETEVSFEAMRSLNHRHSLWLMVAKKGGKIEDARYFEIDIYEHCRSNDALMDESMFMKTLGDGHPNPQPVHFSGINNGFVKIGFFLGEKELEWYINGKKKMSSTFMPDPQDEFYLISSREGNGGWKKEAPSHEIMVPGLRKSDAGLTGESVFNPKSIRAIEGNNDRVEIKYTRAWKVTA